MTETQIKAVVLGHAVADALGVPVEFYDRCELREKPVREMRGFGSYNVPAGSWSDDTSMALCALESLASGNVDFEDIMRNFDRWYYADEFTPTGDVFDIGGTCRRAIMNYHVFHLPALKCGPDTEDDNGNGSLMRIHPFCLYALARDMQDAEAIQLMHDASALSHGHIRSQMACGIYYFVIKALLNEKSVFDGLADARAFYQGQEESKFYTRLYDEIACLGREYTPMEEDDIKSSGYVVHSLEAAIWCLLETDNYRDCVLKAVNLGGDTDTVAAIAGGLAGAKYGWSAISREWLGTLLRLDYIEDMCERAYDAWKK